MGLPFDYTGPAPSSSSSGGTGAIEVTGVQGRVAVRNFDLVQYGTESFAWDITDTVGAAVDFAGKTVRLTLFTTDGTSPVVGIAQYESPAALTIAGSRITRAFSTTDSGTKRVMHYVLWNQTDGIPLARGTIRVTPALRTYP